MGKLFLMINGIHDTIAALSTPKGVGGIAVIRIVGNDCFKTVDKIFQGKTNVLKLDHSKAAFGKIYDGSNLLIDQVIITKFVSPNSFTGEDTIEISCHGGLAVVQEILSLLYINGARPAEPGEFTKRAFLNGKIDLLQAESIADIIHAQTKKSSILSTNQLSGILSKKLILIREELKHQCILLETELDFSEEDLEFADREQINQNVDNLLIEVNNLLNSFKYGKIVRDGVNTVIVGKPNVGKSSLLNKLLEEDRAIISDIPGTTRDSLEELLDIDGLLFKITDTAGLRPTNDVIEEKGVERTKKLIKQADLILYVIDSSILFEFEDVDKFTEVDFFDKHIIIVINKSDIALKENNYSHLKMFNTVKISALTGDGIAELKKRIVNYMNSFSIFDESAVITKVRHRDVLNRTREFLLHAKESLFNELPTEYIASDLMYALDSIGELTGQVTSEEILNDIFSKFCVGK